mmetsp:Transcript_19579/g.32672  ORF Transcript_19579/g.32672 Transcript_19579/m.32672 type:complete len:154 (+) Transcript_19579:331-792(+)
MISTPRNENMRGFRKGNVTKSPTDEMASPISRALFGTSTKAITQKERARVLFGNLTKRNKSNLRVAPGGSKAVNKVLFKPYKSPTDSFMSPASRTLRRSRLSKPLHNRENAIPFSLKTKNHRRHMQILACKNVSASRSSDTVTALGYRSVNIN